MILIRPVPGNVQQLAMARWHVTHLNADPTGAGHLPIGHLPMGHLGMGHLSMVIGAVLLAFGLRYFHQPTRPNTTLPFFLVPPLLLVMTAMAILMMGPQGHMVSWLEGWVCYGLAGGVLLALTWTMGRLAWQTHHAQRQAQRYPKRSINGQPARVLPSTELFSAQVGLWQPELVVSQGLLDRLSDKHQQAVFAHEAAHVHYRDTFWFFWLAGLRRLTGWLPYSEALWQELLLLRELRADRRATHFVDRFVLAEALVQVIASPHGLTLGEDCCTPFSCNAPSRLSRRIDALLEEPTPTAPLGTGPLEWTELCLSLTPLLTIPFHR